MLPRWRLTLLPGELPQEGRVGNGRKSRSILGWGRVAAATRFTGHSPSSRSEVVLPKGSAEIKLSVTLLHICLKVASTLLDYCDSLCCPSHHHRMAVWVWVVAIFREATQVRRKLPIRQNADLLFPCRDFLHGRFFGFPRNIGELRPRAAERFPSMSSRWQTPTATPPRIASALSNQCSDFRREQQSDSVTLYWPVNLRLGQGSGGKSEAFVSIRAGQRGDKTRLRDVGTRQNSN